MGYWRWAIGDGRWAMGYGLWVRGERGEVMDMKNSVVEEPRCFFIVGGPSATSRTSAPSLASRTSATSLASATKCS